MDVQVANPKMLLLIWLVPAVVFWWLHMEARRERALQRFMSEALQQRLRPATSRRRFLWQVGLLAAGLTLAIASAARPQWGSHEEKVFQRGRDLVVVLDVSRSMLATDVRPNRLQRAKTDLIDLVKELKGDRAALLAFRRRATLLCPLTTDYAYFRQALEGAGPDSAPRGETDIGEAIREALNAFDSEGGAHKAIILITDGEDLAGNARAAATEAAERGVVIVAVGLGSRDGATIPDTDQQSGTAMYGGETIRTKLDNVTLDDIAKLTGGAYVPVETASMTTTTLGTLYRDHLRSISEQDIEERLERRYVERYQWFLFPGLLCLLAAAALSCGRLAARRSSPPPAGAKPPVPGPAPLKNLTPPPRPLKAIAVAFAALGLALGSANAATNDIVGAAAVVAGTNQPALPDLPPGRTGARVAQRLFAKGDYAAAAQAYLAAAKGATETSQQDFRYNAAVALYRDGQYQAAAELLRTLSEDARRTDARAPLGLGAALFQSADTLDAEDAPALRERAKLTRDAAEAFRLATRAAPDDEHARRNAAVALQALPEREESAHIAEVLAKHQGADAGRVAAEMLLAQRGINDGIAAAMTNAAPSRIRDLEMLAKRQRENADLWIPLKGLLLQAQMAGGTNAPVDPAELAQLIEVTRDGMHDAANQLRDLDPAGAAKATLSEATIYQLWKATAGYGELLREDLWRQTNAITATSQPPGPMQMKTIEAEQQEALALTDLFTVRFEEQVPEAPVDGGAGAPPAQVMPGAGNALDIPPSGTATNIDRAKIIDLAAQAKATQASALNFLGTGDLEESRMQQELSYKILKEIEVLLPKSQSSQQQQQDQQQNPEQNPDESESQQEQQQNPAEQDQQPQEQQPEEQAEQEEAEAEEPEPKDERNVDVQRLLDRALEREREHEANKRQRLDSLPLSPTDRDW